MDFIIKRRNNADAIEHVSGTNILIRPGDRRYANFHVLNNGRAVFTTPTDWVEIQDCGRCLAITLGDVRHQRVTTPAWQRRDAELPPAA